MASYPRWWLLGVPFLVSLVRLGQPFTAEFREKLEITFRAQQWFLSCYIKDYVGNLPLDSENWVFEISRGDEMVYQVNHTSSEPTKTEASWMAERGKYTQYNKFHSEASLRIDFTDGFLEEDKAVWKCSYLTPTGVSHMDSWDMTLAPNYGVYQNENELKNLLTVGLENMLRAMDPIQFGENITISDYGEVHKAVYDYENTFDIRIQVMKGYYNVICQTMSYSREGDRCTFLADPTYLVTVRTQMFGGIVDSMPTYLSPGGTTPGPTTTLEPKPCESNPCGNSASCLDIMQPGSSPRFFCTCADGWRGTTCELDMNTCRSNPCLNNARSCYSLPDYYRCNCAYGFTGDHCETDINECASTPCKNNGLCTDGIRQFSCTCFDGYWTDRCQSHLGDLVFGSKSMYTYQEGPWNIECRIDKVNIWDDHVMTMYRGDDIAYVVVHRDVRTVEPQHTESDW